MPATLRVFPSRGPLGHRDGVVGSSDFFKTSRDHPPPGGGAEGPGSGRNRVPQGPH